MEISSQKDRLHIDTDPDTPKLQAIITEGLHGAPCVGVVTYDFWQWQLDPLKSSDVADPHDVQGMALIFRHVYMF